VLALAEGTRPRSSARRAEAAFSVVKRCRPRNEEYHPKGCSSRRERKLVRQTGNKRVRVHGEEVWVGRSWLHGSRCVQVRRRKTACRTAASRKDGSLG